MAPPLGIVFVPGFMQRGAAWAPVAERLGERYSTTLLDHRAHDREGRIEEIARAGEGALVVGYSLGGRLALHAVLRDPGRYCGLVTVGASAGLEGREARAARLDADEEIAGWMRRTPIEDVVGVWERQPLFADQSEALVEEQRAGRLSFGGEELASMLRSAGQGAMKSVWHRLPNLDLPLLAVAGARDERYSSAARRMADLAPQGRYAIVEEAGHAPQLQRPDAVADLIVGL